jgi:hypothetical protein
MGRKNFALVDPELVEDSLFLRRALGEPALSLERPIFRTAQACGSVLRDAEGQWRMWYMMPVARDPKKDVVGCDNLQCLALSRDGLNWERPNLGLVEEAGSRKNNVVIGSRQRDRNGRYLTGTRRFRLLRYRRDDRPPPARPEPLHRMYLASPTDTYGGICMAHSEDGITLEAYPENPVIPGSQDTQNCFLFDPRIGKYVCYQRPTIYCGVGSHANASWRASRALISCTGACRASSWIPTSATRLG